MRNKKMTLKYWNTLERGTRERALSFVFGNQKFTIELMLDETPTAKTLKDSCNLWPIVFAKAKIPADNSVYKVEVNGTYMR